jgi:hypothetical protein
MLAHDNPVKAKFGAWDDALSQASRDELEGEARRLWKLAGGSREGAKSFWIARNSSPRCAVERLALDVAARHFRPGDDGAIPEQAGGVEWSSVLGAEFWVQVRESSDDRALSGLEFHFDKDEKALEEWDVFAHPALATATYLTRGGAPLVVFSTTIDGDAEAEAAQASRSAEAADEDGAGDADAADVARPADDVGTAEDATDPDCGHPEGVPTDAGDAGAAGPSRAWIAFPAPRRHVCFAGDLLHGVPAELLELPASARGGPRPAKRRRRERSSYTRISILVNVWTSHQPTGVAPLSEDALRRIVAPENDAAAGEPTGGNDANAEKATNPRGGRAAEGERDRPADASAKRLDQLDGPMRPSAFRRCSCDPADAASAHVLSEHREGDTGVLPLRPLLDVLNSARTEAGAETKRPTVLAIEYSCGDPEPLSRARRNAQ